MKHIPFIILCSLSVFAGCEYGLPEIPKPIHYEKHPAPEPPAPEIEAGGSIPMVFTGFFGDAVTTRADISGNEIKWTANDQILVLWNGGFNFASAAAAGSSTEFSTDVNESDTYWAFYPSSLEGSVNSEGLSITIPDRQYGDFSKVNIAIASTGGENKDFVFRNLCGLGSFTLTRPDIAKIEFKGMSDETLAGNVLLNIDENGIPSVASASSAKNSITIVPSAENSFPAGTYYFAAIPGALDKGVTFTLTTVSGGTILGKAMPAPDVLNRSEIRSFGTLDITNSLTTITLSFDFLCDPFGEWPGASQEANKLEDIDAIYPLDGIDYKFALRFPSTNSTSAAGAYWAAASGNYGNRLIINGKYKYAGLPVIPGYKLVKVNLWQTRVGASDKTKVPAIAIADDVPEKVLDASSDMSLAEGGSPQAWRAGVAANSLNGPYTYNLTDTEAGANYYIVLYSTNEWNSNVAGIGKIELTYENATDNLQN